jgi:hypothetical protein
MVVIFQTRQQIFGWASAVVHSTMIDQAATRSVPIHFDLNSYNISRDSKPTPISIGSLQPLDSF